MEFSVLGPVGATVGRHPVDIGPARQRCVLAALLIDVGQIVSTDQLIYRVWAEDPPRGVRNTLQSYLARLRAVVQSPEADGITLVRQAGGYVLEAPPERVDLHRFRLLVDQGHEAGDEKGAVLLREALGLWQANVLGGVSGAWVEGMRQRLDEERLTASLLYQDIQLSHGRHEELLPGLRDLVASHPFDERLAARLMTVLSRCGRQAEALRLYERVRGELAEQLGVDPGPELRARHLDVLSSAPAPARPATAPALPVPRQLPPAPVGFEGRARELAELNLMDEQDTNPVRTLVGTGGVGKTYLALHWAHKHLDRFPDGQLYANLRGFNPAGEYQEPGTVLRGFLEGLGIEPAAIPVDHDARSALYRSLVAGRRLLVVVDDVRDAAHVIPLLPGGTTCVVLITSRNQLADLTVTHGARTLTLDVLPPAEARRMLTRHIGRSRVAAEAEAVTALLEHCAGLPLALGILASRVLTHPEFPLAFLAEELREESSRLDALHVGGPSTDIRAVIASSYRALDPAATSALGLLGIAPGPNIGLRAAAALLDQPLPSTRKLLRTLEDAHLVQQYVPGRYRMHDLVRLYAIETAERDMPDDEREVAMRNLVGFLLRGATTADRLLYPNRPQTDLHLPGDRHAAYQPPRDLAEALAWFDTEYTCVLAAQRLTVARSWDLETLQLAWTLDTFCWRRVYQSDRLDFWTAGLAAAERLGEPADRAIAHWRLGFARAQAGQRDQVLDSLHRALGLFEEVGDRVSQAHVHQSFGWVFSQRGEHQQALGHAQWASAVYQLFDNPVWKANALNAVAWCMAQLDRHEEAYVHCEQALSLFRTCDDLDGEAATQDSMGYIAHHMGRHVEAVGHYLSAVELRDATGNAGQKADSMVRLGDAYAAQGRRAEACRTWESAAGLYRGQHRFEDARLVRAKLDALIHPGGSARP